MIKNFLRKILFVVLILYPISIYAQEYVYVDEFGVGINANITTDLYSQLDLNPNPVELNQPSNVNLRLLNPDGTPKPNRTIIINVVGDNTGVYISQPATTDIFGQTTGSIYSLNSGTYTVCSKDTTEGYDILIVDCENLYVVPLPVPTMIAEPAYTKGTTNMVMWSMPGSSIYQYYTQVSKNSSFSVIENNSGWISNLAHEFPNLQDGQMYFYRVKAKNIYGGESTWSNTVFSVQDSQGPTIELISISDSGDNYTTQWDPNFSINIKYRIKDNTGISKREFWCIRSDGSKDECEYTSIIEGDFWNISIKLEDLERKKNNSLLQSYQFCVEATDSVDNVNRNCEGKIEIKTKEPEIPTEPEKPFNPITPVIEKIEEVFKNVVDNTIAKLDPVELQNITVTTATTNVIVGLGSLLTLLGNLPYFILQVILAVSSLLGFRKKGNITGYVYNSLTKEPIRQAIVRVYNENAELIWTDVTDSNGYFRTIDVKDGEYAIDVTSSKHTFPSKVIFGKTDFPLENVYHGDPFLTRENKIPKFSIPMDEKEMKEIEKIVGKLLSRTKSLWKSLHILLFVIGLIFSIYALHISPIWYNYLIISLYIPSLIALINSFISKKEKYGLVKDEEGEIVSGAIIALNEKEFDKLISKRITDSLGRYRFIVEKGKYQLSILNTDLEIINEGKYSEIEIKESGGQLICPNIVVKRKILKKSS